jgi:hypothetical protein
MNYQLPIIEKFIIKHFPDIMDVYFTEKRVYLGSSYDLPEEERTITQTVINIVINNLKNNLQYSEKRQLSHNIIDKLEGGFGINYRLYGSKWDIAFHIAEIKKYNWND